MMGVTFQPVQVNTGSDDVQGALAFEGGKLIAVLVRLSDEHGDTAGRWFVEHAFGSLDCPLHPTFKDLRDVESWVESKRREPDWRR